MMISIFVNVSNIIWVYLLLAAAPFQAGVLDESAAAIGVRPPAQLSLPGPPEELYGVRPPGPPPPLPRPMERGCLEIGL